MNNTAVLIFANTSETEQINKSFSFGSHLFASLNERTIQIVEKTGIPYFHISEKEQVGKNFGERFTNAILQVFDKGYNNIITIGNDTPGFSRKHLELAAQKISTSEVVVGPSRDGGFYLLGINRKNFNPEVFKAFPWQTSGLTKALISNFQSNSKIQIQKLETLADLDTYKDLKQLQEKISHFSESLKKAILQLLISFLPINSFISTYSLEVEKIPVFNKGSPVFFRSTN